LNAAEAAQACDPPAHGGIRYRTDIQLIDTEIFKSDKNRLIPRDLTLVSSFIASDRVDNSKK
jgi:hypothetical protein